MVGTTGRAVGKSRAFQWLTVEEAVCGLLRIQHINSKIKIVQEGWVWERDGIVVVVECTFR